MSFSDKQELPEKMVMLKLSGKFTYLIVFV